MSKVENGTVFIKCSSAQDSEAIVQTLNSENNNILTAKACEKNNPQIRITNILSDVGKEELADDIINRNQLPPNSVIITYTYKQKNDNHAALAQVTCDAYAKIMKTEHVFVGYQNCKVYDNYNINRCKNCCGYNHSFKICKEKIKRPQA